MAFNLIFTLDTKFIKYEEEGTTVILTINRPEALNALNNQVLDDLEKILAYIDINHMRAIILTGAGEKSFIAGTDILQMYKLTTKEAEDLSKKVHRIFQRIENYPIPFIAAINGLAIGGGCEISLTCDFRICSENAIFGLPETTFGIIPGFGGTQRLSRLIGMGRAKNIILTGENIDANEAYRIGLVTGVYPQNELLNEAKKLAAKISKNGFNAVKNAKFAMNQGIEYNLIRGLEIEEKSFSMCFETTEQRERMQNYLEKNTKKLRNLRGLPEIPEKEEKNFENEELPKGELKPQETFKKSMKLLKKDLTIPSMPSILTVGDKDKYNSMTIAWGSIDVRFSRPVFTVFVKPEKFTYQLIEKSEIFTVSYINKNLFSKFSIYGTQSGRDINKEDVSGNSIQFLDDDGITFKEAVEVYVCRIIKKAHLQENEEHKDIINIYKEFPKDYPTIESLVVYIGEIIGHYKRE